MKCSRGIMAIIAGIFNMQINIIAAIYFNHEHNLYMEETNENGTSLWSMAWFFCILGIVVSILMIAGVIMKNDELIKPYLKFGGFALIASGLVWVLIIGVYIWHLVPFFSLCDMLTRAILVEGIQILLLLPAFSAYNELRDEANATRKSCTKNDNILNSTNQDVYGAEKIPVDAGKIV